MNSANVMAQGTIDKVREMEVLKNLRMSGKDVTNLGSTVKEVQEYVESVDFIPLSEDTRVEIPSDPLFIKAVIDEAERDPWEVVLQYWFSPEEPVIRTSPKYDHEQAKEIKKELSRHRNEIHFSGMTKFVMERRFDENGISGTGVVVEGVIFGNGQCVAHWLTPYPNGSMVVWPNFDDFMKIHVNSHPNNETIIRFEDGSIIDHRDA